MITDLPFYVYITFFAALVFALIIFYYAINKNTKIILAVILLGIIQSSLTILGFYDNTMTTPPRFMLMVLPLMIIIISSIFSKNMRAWLYTLDLKLITIIHIVRIPVELVLYWLFLYKYVPELITFEGRNYDILAGITAPFIVLMSFRNGIVKRKLLLVWNIISILLLMNILFFAVTSMPTILQQYAFDQPNIAVMKFPFLLLPAVIVPIVLISNVAGIVILSKR